MDHFLSGAPIVTYIPGLTRFIGSEHASFRLPNLESGNEFRVSAGYVLPARNSRYLLRAQYVIREMDFESTYPNDNFIYDQIRNQFTGGIAFVF